MKFYNDFNSMFNAQSGVKQDKSVFNEVEKSDRYADCDTWDVFSPAPLFGKSNCLGGGDLIYAVVFIPSYTRTDSEPQMIVDNVIKERWGGGNHYIGEDLGYIQPLRKLSKIALDFVSSFCSLHPAKPTIHVLGPDADQIGIEFKPEYNDEYMFKFGKTLAEYLDKYAVPKIVKECGLFQTEKYVPEDDGGFSFGIKDDESISFGGDRYSFI